MGENIYENIGILSTYSDLFIMISRHFLCFNHHSFHHFRWFFGFCIFPWFATGRRSCGPAIRVGPQTRRFCWENGDRVAWCLFVCWFLDVFVGQKGYCSVAALQCFFFFFPVLLWQNPGEWLFSMGFDWSMVTWLKAKPQARINLQISWNDDLLGPLRAK